MKKRGKNKAQAALDFLMTYGWAIMVVLVVIGALSYFGLLSPDKFIPRKCSLEPGISCTDFRINGDSATLVIKNTRGENIDISEIRVGNCSGANYGILKDGEQGIFVVGGCDNTGNNKFSGDIDITYAGESGLSRMNKGSIFGEVENGLGIPDEEEQGVLPPVEGEEAIPPPQEYVRVVLTDVTLVHNCGSNSCIQGERISVNANYGGKGYPLHTYIQVDMSSNDGTCKLKYTLGQGVDMKGVYAECSKPNVCGTWTVPSVPDECFGKTVNIDVAALYEGGYSGKGVWRDDTTDIGDTTSGSFRFSTPCTLTGVSIAPNCGAEGCKKGDTISVNAVYSGDDCPSTAYIQVDADDSSNCMLGYNGGDMKGIYATCSASGNCGTWAIPEIADDCFDKNVYARSASLFENGYPGAGILKDDTNDAGDSISGSLKFSIPCFLRGVSITPNCGSSCGQGNTVSINAAYDGDKCPSTAYIQVDMSNIDDTCKLEYVTGPNVDIKGAYATCSASGNCGTWTVPSLANDCFGETVNIDGAALYKKGYPDTGTWMDDTTDIGDTTSGSFTFTPWLAGWSYRKPITITGSAPADYQVLVTTNTQELIPSKMKSDCSDIRLTKSDAKTLLPYWIESGCGTSSTKIWVNVNFIPQTIYMYYGNSTVASASSKDLVFSSGSFTDTFTDQTKINTVDSSNIVVSGGEVKISETTSQLTQTSDVDFNTGTLDKLEVNATGQKAGLVLQRNSASGAWSNERLVYDQNVLYRGGLPIAIDSNSYPHLDYGYGYSSFSMMYKYWDGSQWNTQTVTSGMSYIESGQDSLDLDSNNYAHIVYYHGTKQKIEYAHWTDSSWAIYTTSLPRGGAGIVVDSNNYPHITGKGQYLKWTGSSWQTYSTPGGVYATAIDSQNHPHILYKSGYDFYYARWTGSAWGDTRLICNAGGDWSKCAYGTLDVDHNDKPHVTWSNDGYSVRYSTNSGGSWIDETVSSSRCGLMDTSVAVDSKNIPHIIFAEDCNPYVVSYFSRQGTGSWSKVDIWTLSKTAYNNPLVSLAIDKNDFPHTIWKVGRPRSGADSGNNELWYAHYFVPYYSAGIYTSKSFDTSQQSKFNYISWSASILTGTSVKFQIATNNDGTTWNFVGPDGTAGSYYTTSGQTVWSGHNGNRYMKYKAYLSTTDSSKTPTLSDITINYGYYNTPASLISVAIPQDTSTRLLEGKQFSWNDNEPVNTDVRYKMQYNNGGTWSLIPDSVLPGNAAGFDDSPKDISSVKSNYGQIRLNADLSTSDTSVTPKVQDWNADYYYRKYISPEPSANIGVEESSQ